MNFKKVLYGILLLGFSSLSAGAETLYLHVFDNAGNWIVMNLDEVDRIGYDAGTIKFSYEVGKELKAVDAASLTTMIVNESKSEVTGVESVSADVSGSGITLRGRLISADESRSCRLSVSDWGVSACR